MRAITNLPTREWLADQYLLPPKGLGKSTRVLARELGVSRRQIQRWLNTYGLTEDASRRISAWRTGRRSWSKPEPQYEWLRVHYQLPPDGLGWTLHQIAEGCQVSLPTVRRWLKEMGLTQGFSARHSRRTSGEGNPAYRNGDSQRYVKKELGRRQSLVCIWCGTEDDIQVHHLDHNRSNNKPENLTWLCRHCNLVEAHLWALSHKGRAQVEWEGNMLIVRFTGKE